MITIRLAEQDDIEAILSFDEVAQNNQKRIDQIKHVVENGTCYVGLANSKIIAYGVFSYNFYECGMIEMIYVHADFRRQGIGNQFLSFFKKICKTDKLFTSTNESNIPMQKSLIQAQFLRSGIIYNLDEKDPELVYFKQVK